MSIIRHDELVSKYSIQMTKKENNGKKEEEQVEKRMPTNEADQQQRSSSSSSSREEEEGLKREEEPKCFSQVCIINVILMQIRKKEGRALCIIEMLKNGPIF